MSKHSENIARKEERNKKQNIRKEKLASYFFDVSKLVIAGIVIGGITPIENNGISMNHNIVFFGSIAAIFFAWIGNKILK